MHRILLLLLLGLAVTLGADRSAQAYDHDSTTIDTEARAVDSPSVLFMAIDWASPIEDVTNADALDRAPEREVADTYRIDRHETVLTAYLSIRIDVGGMQTDLDTTFYDMDADRAAGLFDDSGADGIWI